jgi:hypothetical protein
MVKTGIPMSTKIQEQTPINKTIFKTGDMLKVFFYDTSDDKIPYRTSYGIIVDDTLDINGHITGRYLHDHSLFSITNNGEVEDRYGRIILEKVS